MRHAVFGETPMGPEWGTNCTIGVPTVDACVNASLVEDSGRVEGNLDAGASLSPLPIPLHSRLSIACAQHRPYGTCAHARA